MHRLNASVELMNILDCKSNFFSALPLPVIWVCDMHIDGNTIYMFKYALNALSSSIASIAIYRCIWFYKYIG